MVKKNATKQTNLKNTTKKPQAKKRKRGRFDAIDIIALIIFIAIGVGIVAGTIWYYAFHLPRAAAEMEEVSVKFTQEFFDVHYDTITGEEGFEWLTAGRAETMRAMSDRVHTWQTKKVIARVESEIEVQILERGWNSGKARVIFWQYEEEATKAGRELLMFYDYEFSHENGRWLINRIVTATRKDLEDLRRARGILDNQD
jgi:hypothetical protein